METLEELERNNRLRQNALAPVVAELMEINRQMAEHNKEMIAQQQVIITLLMNIRNHSGTSTPVEPGVLA